MLIFLKKQYNNVNFLESLYKKNTHNPQHIKPPITSQNEEKKTTQNNNITKKT